MKKISVLLFFATIISSLCAQNLKTNMDSVSYSLGVLIAQNLKQQGVEKVDAASLTTAVTDVFAGSELKIAPAECNAIFQSYMEEQSKKAHGSKIEEGMAYLAENAKRPEVKTTASGLQYEVLTAGAGASPGESDQVTVHYEGSLTNGTIFDSSYKRNSPATFGVTQVIGGWVEALQMMKLGDKWKLTIPYDLAYGERGAPPSIPPYATLIFTVELLSIN